MKLTLSALQSGTEAVAVVGLGYVGLPLAVHLARHFSVIGYDRKSERIQELIRGEDRTLEVSAEELKAASIRFTDRDEELQNARLIIVAVPTPIDESRIPDLSPLKTASEIVGRFLLPGACVVYESTVYPGATEEVCIPILEKASGLVFGKDFTVGYSPERINPGDRLHTLERIVKVVSGSDEATTRLLEQVYGAVVSAGIHTVSSIKVAEAAKVIENTQRDLNIALMNELAMIFDKIGIDTAEVLAAAGTKWNFLPFRPGLVGGHCIGVDPYYLTFKAEALGYHPEMILAGRRINDGMGKYIAERAVKMLIRSGCRVNGTRVAVLGLTFKEDVPDLRNTRVVDIVRELQDYGIEVLVHDPLADPSEAADYYGIELKEMEALGQSDAVVVAVAHRLYLEMGIERIAGLCASEPALVLDVKSAFDKAAAEALSIDYRRI
ncbi:MAG: nucleotide sugar dehydrogenase [Desulfobacterales bacterium]|nr:nucleotide sugar dehydrogenase [Desulfobacterales bacterium]